jgi:hypothetical protein
MQHHEYSTNYRLQLLLTIKILHSSSQMSFCEITVESLPSNAKANKTQLNPLRFRSVSDE